MALRDSLLRHEFLAGAIFEALECGVFPSILQFFKDCTDVAQKRAVSQLLTIYSQGCVREMKKMVNGGLISVLCKEMATGPDYELKLNCLEALSNIARCGIEFRDLVLRNEPEIFDRIVACILGQKSQLNS